MEDLQVWELLKKFRKYILLILVCSIVGAGGFAFVANRFISKEYQSVAQLLVNQRNQNENVDVSDIQKNVMLINTYQDIILAQTVLSTVTEQMGNQFTVEELRDSISVNQQDNSQTFYITVTMGSPNVAQEVTNLLVEAFIEIVNEVYEGELSGIYILSPATYNANPVAPSIPRSAFIGLVVGAFLGIIIALFRELSDTTVKDDELFVDLKLNKLGEIYELNSSEVNRARKKMGTNIKRRVIKNTNKQELNTSENETVKNSEDKSLRRERV